MPLVPLPPSSSSRGQGSGRSQRKPSGGHRIIFVSASDDHHDEEWLSALRQAVSTEYGQIDPSAAVPEIDVAHVTDHWAEIEKAAGAGGCPLFLIRLDDGKLISAHYHLIDLLVERRLPAIFLSEARPSCAGTLLAEGHVICSPTDQPSLLAARIRALLTRQKCVDRLGSELKLALRYHSGLNGAMVKLQEELQIAAMIQRQLLPASLPELDDVRMGVLFRPCSTVSGDIYDAFALDDHRLGFIVADAVGHGVPAALMTIDISRCLKSALDRNQFEPGKILERLNSDLAMHREFDGRFATAICGVIDTDTHVVRLAGAGHPPPVVLHPDGSVRAIETTGGLLGVFPDETYPEVSVELKDRERLLVYTDGFEMAFPEAVAEGCIPEVRSPSTRYLSRFSTLFHPDTPLKMALEHLADSLDEQAGSLNQADDLTAFCIASS
ncbi:MAG: serine/threonine-protein phosphatase [Planctomycetes bacterium]|nr:serine/threonine-protein phosphatase [Planctomycetota bacterium]